MTNEVSMKVDPVTSTDLDATPNTKRKIGSPSPSPTRYPISPSHEVKLEFDINQSTDVIEMLQHIDDLLDSTKYCVQKLKIRQNEERIKTGCKSAHVDEHYTDSRSVATQIYKPDSLTQQSSIQNMIHNNIQALV